MKASQDYYTDPFVRSRILEFLGGDSPDNSCSVYITGEDGSPEMRFAPKPTSELTQCLDRGLEIGRSLWDRESLIAHLDIEYVNFDSPGAVFLEPERPFEFQRPTVRAVEELLTAYGIAPLHLLSGRGHHFVWRVGVASRAFEELASLGRVSKSLHERYDQPHPPSGARVANLAGAAYSGLGLVMEFLAHQVLQKTYGHSALPVMITAVEAGPNGHGREIVSVDVSEYGDPLHTRGIRTPFSVYLKPCQQRWMIGDAVDTLAPLFLIPLHEMSEQEGLTVMRSEQQTRDLARRSSTQIPEQAEGTSRLIEAYQRSSLARWHDEFYGDEHEPPSSWPATYDRTPLEAWPPCIRLPLERPNDWLLRPAVLRHITRGLLAAGWRPRHIAGLVRSKYERDHGWGPRWYWYDASLRADFYVRLFAGLVAVGRDRLIDFNCRSHQEKGYCPGIECRDNLLRIREQLSQQISSSDGQVSLHER